MSGIDNAAVITSAVQDIRGPYSGQYPALTTPFQYPTTCGNEWYQVSPNALPQAARSEYFSIDAVFGTYWRSCQPEGKSAFSPGVCPSDYYVAAITEYHDIKGGSSRYWGAMCCGKDYTFFANADASRYCASTLGFSQELEVYRMQTVSRPTSINGKPFTAVDSSYDAHGNTTTVTGGTKFYQPPFVYWQASDLSLFEPSYASALASRLKIPFTPTNVPASTTAASASMNASPASSPTSLPRPTSSSSTDSSNTSKSGLSAGAIAGICIGAAIALAIAAFLVYRCMRRRKTAEDTHTEKGSAELAADEGYDGQNDAHNIGELHGGAIGELPSSAPYKYSELPDAYRITELPDGHKINELPGPIAELDGGTVRKDR